MMDINQTILLGRLGADPVLRVTKGGTPVASFTLATQSYQKNTEESETTWHRVVAWGRPAELCGVELKKGMPLFVEGKMKVRKFENAKGEPQYMHEVHASRIRFLHARSKVKIATELESLATEELN